MLSVWWRSHRNISFTLEQLPETKEVHVVAACGEVKELLLLMEAGHNDDSPDKPHSPEPTITAVDGTREFSFRPSEEAKAEVRYATGLGKYLYHPSKAFLKAGAFRLAAERFGLMKLAPSTHLYTHSPARSPV